MKQMLKKWQPASEANMDPSNNLFFLDPSPWPSVCVLLVLQPHLSKNPGSGPGCAIKMGTS